MFFPENLEENQVGEQSTGNWTFLVTECIEAALLYIRVMAHNGNTSELTEELRVNYNLVQTLTQLDSAGHRAGL